MIDKGIETLFNSSHPLQCPLFNLISLRCALSTVPVYRPLPRDLKHSMRRAYAIWTIVRFNFASLDAYDIASWDRSKTREKGHRDMMVLHRRVFDITISIYLLFP